MNIFFKWGGEFYNQTALTEWEKFQIKLEVRNKIQALLSSASPTLPSSNGLFTSMSLLLNLQV